MKSRNAAIYDITARKRLSRQAEEPWLRRQEARVVKGKKGGKKR